MVLSAADPPVRAVWITAGNPVAMLPESATVDRALRSREFVCVVDSWLTDTARAATLVLPCPTLLEQDDLIGAYGHHFVGSSRPVVPPPEGVLSDLEILQRLAPRVGLAGLLDGTPREWKQRILRRDAGFTVDQLDADGPQRSALSPQVLFADRRFATKTGRVNLVAEGPPRSRLPEDFPLFLMALSTDKAQSSQWSKKQSGPAVVTVHPESAGGVPDGGAAVLESAIGSLPIQVRHDPRQRRDVALLPKGGHLRDGRCANLLARARATDIGGGGALYDEGVRIRKAPSTDAGQS
jgi:anaerobic selenocysteine-containing dehydrogenase